MPTKTSEKPAAAPAASAPAATVAARQPVPDLRIEFAGISLKNPVIAASGTFGYGIEFEDVVTLNKLGGFVTKGLSPEPMAGNPPPRIFETAAGMLNSIGLQNIGARAFVEEKLPLLRRKKNLVIICNVFGYTRQEYEQAIRILNEGEGIAGYELNVSCPNTAHGGITSIPRMARAAENAGADAISLVNTFVAMSIDAETRRPRISNVTAGLSGPAIKPIALRMVYEAAHSVDIPVIGMGGIATAEDVIEFMLAGAAAVEVGTANYFDPCATEKIVDGVRSWCIEHRVERISDLIGALKTE
jgi:dihydroorotate dehydrogenase (NAD+) catalytic subunit